MSSIKKWCQKYREGVLYLFFGGLTTAVNYIVYMACYYFLPVTATTVPNLIAWVGSVLFAYLTNRTWVFRSETRGLAGYLRELASFAGARVFTLLVETAVLWLAVDSLGLPNLPVKILANILVIVLNYFLSKFWIFKKKRPVEPEGNSQA